MGKKKICQEGRRCSTVCNNYINTTTTTYRKISLHCRPDEEDIFQHNFPVSLSITGQLNLRIDERFHTNHGFIRLFDELSQVLF